MATNGDKRSVATDALETLGTIIDASAGRDAIHLAVEPAVAAHVLRPGEDVGFLEDGTVGMCDKPLGIVDPFLKAPVRKGERFWLVVYPRQITSLRHVWTHPAFEGRQQTSAEQTPLVEILDRTPQEATAWESKAWLMTYAATIPVKYDQLLRHASYWLEDDEYWSEGGRFEGESLPEDFWDHYENVTGEKVPSGKRGSFFSCSC